MYDLPSCFLYPAGPLVECYSNDPCLKHLEESLHFRTAQKFLLSQLIFLQLKIALNIVSLNSMQDLTLLQNILLVTLTRGKYIRRSGAHK